MTRKNLSDAASAGGTGGASMDLEDLLQWCADANVRAERMGADWWYYVIRSDSGRFAVVKADGSSAISMRAQARGEKIERYVPTPEDLASIKAFIAECAAKNMTQQDFNLLVQRTGGAPRPAVR